MDLATAAVELYALLPGEYTDARNKRAKELGRSGDKELAQQIRGLPKPSAAAWLVNMLANRRPDLIEQVLELGASLRQAQEELDQQQLKDLSDQRHKLLSAVMKDARELADELGQRISGSVADEVDQTLRSAMADPDAADAVASGQLTRSLSSTGWEPVDLSHALAVPEAVERSASSAEESTSQKAGRAKEPDETEVEAEGEKATEATKKEKETEPPKQPKRGKTDGEAQEGRKKRARKKISDDEAQEATGSKEDKPAAEDKEAERRLTDAKGSLTEAEEQVQEAESKQESVEKQLEETDAKHENLAAEIEELKDRLRKLERERGDVDKEIDRLERDQDDAIRSAKDARRAASRARRRVKEPS